MLATLADAPLVDPNLVYEPKYDGIRALISVEQRGRSVGRVRVGPDDVHHGPSSPSARTSMPQPGRLYIA